MFPVPEFAIRPKLKLEKLVSEFSLVADVVAQVEVVGHDSTLQILNSNSGVTF